MELRNFKTLFTGSRNWTDYDRIRTAFEEIQESVSSSKKWGVLYNGFELMHGACPGEGGDFLADKTGKELGWQVEPRPADWDHCGPECPRPVGHRVYKRKNDIYHPGELDDFCPKAGSRRNAKMVAEKHDLCISCIRGISYGTSNCTMLADRAGIKVIRYLS